MISEYMVNILICEKWLLIDNVRIYDGVHGFFIEPSDLHVRFGLIRDRP